MRVPLLLLLFQGCSARQAVDSATLEVCEVEDIPEYRAATREDLEGPWTNRLVQETSPYLLMHAHNPVDWYPWGEEAFAEARRRDVPVFLSIGYAACHWCHVMEEESFQDPEIAAYLNEHFVAVKVDREERPDVDALYMEAIHLMQGSGGWPASLWLTPDRVPFYAGTYFPPRARYGRPGFLEILQAMSRGWTEDREGVLQTTGRVQEILEEAAVPSALDRSPGPADVRRGVDQLLRHWDTVYAGWGQRNKFPMPSRLEFLLAYGQDHEDSTALQRVREGLEAMDRGGIHDHLGGGFHRYTVDTRWQVPHFEKMLYDNAQLLALYAEASVVLEEERFAQVARDVATYMLRDLREGSGALFSSEDADSPGGEGSYYVWTPQEVESLLPADQARAFIEAYAVTPQGNFEEHTTVLTRVGEADPSSDLLASARATLWVERGKREPPPIDTKRVVAWNGMALGALARAGRLLGDADLVEAAAEIAAEVLDGADEQGRLPRTLERNAPRGSLDDQAFVALGLLDLYEADPDPRWLLAADRLAGVMLRDFHDSEQGGFYVSIPEADDLLVRRMDATDGAEPSGLGVATRVLWRLRSLGSEHGSAEIIDGAIRSAGSAVSQSPSSVPSLLGVVDHLSRNSMEVVLACDPGQESSLEPFLAAYHQKWRPDAVLAVVTPPQLETLADFGALRGKLPGEGEPRAYVCFDGVCKMPTSDLDVFVQTMDAGAPR